MLGLLEPRGLYRELFGFRRDFEEMFNRMIGATPALTGTQTFEEIIVPPVEAWTDPEAKKFYLRVAVPGIEPKEVKVEVQGNVLTISGERKHVETKALTYHQREFTYGAFQRVLTLPEGVDVEKLTAQFTNGVLELTAPLAAAALPRRIEIKPALKKAA